MKQQLPEQYQKMKFGGGGAFAIPRIGKKTGEYYMVLATTGLGWDHVSVSIPSERRCPTWEEMCYIKDLFFEPEECAVQYHPSKKDYVNNHPYCLHIWRCQSIEIPKPDPSLVGIK